MNSTFSLPSTRLAGLLCSRLCHDLISPVSVLTTALSVLDDPASHDMHDDALDLIRTGVKQAAQHLDFARMAFGSSGFDDKPIDVSEIRTLTHFALDSRNITLNWACKESSLPVKMVRLLLNLCLISTTALARGGAVDLTTQKPHNNMAEMMLDLSGPKPALPPSVSEALQGRTGDDVSDGKMIQAYYTWLMLHEAGFQIQFYDKENTLKLHITQQGNTQG